MSANTNQPEVWMRGPVAGVPALFQPVAHALLQAHEEVERYLSGFDDSLLWAKPGGMASVGFHLQHLSGVVDRLFAYAREEALSNDQFVQLRAEGVSDASINSSDLVRAFGQQVQDALRQLRETDESALAEPRYLGRKRIPTTLIGLLF